MKRILIVGEEDRLVAAALMQLIEYQPVPVHNPPLDVRYLLNEKPADTVDGKFTVNPEDVLTVEFKAVEFDWPVETYAERFETYRPYGKKHRRSLRR